MSFDREKVPPTPRRAMTPKRRVEVFTKSEGKCHRCGIKLHPGAWEADHELSLFLGGADDLTNLVALCVPCHRGEKTPADASRHGKLRRLILKNDPETRPAPKMKSGPSNWPKGRKIASRGFQKRGNND